MRRLALMAVVGAMLMSVPATAGAASPAPKPVSVAAHFTRSKLGPAQVSVSTGWAAVTRGSAVTLIDESTGKTTKVTMPAGCALADASRAQLLLQCVSAGQGTQELEDIATGQVSPIAVNPALDCASDATGACSGVTRIGTEWMAVVGSCPLAEHCEPPILFQSLATGQLVNDPTSSTVVPDMNSPTLAQHLCPSVTVPVITPGFSLPDSGFVQMDGQFGIATGEAGTYLERCGSPLHQHLTFTPSPVFNSHLVLWQSKPGLLKGLFLPSLKPFTIAVPRTVDHRTKAAKFVGDDPYELALAHGTMYLVRGTFNAGPAAPLWTMPMPTHPPKVKKPKPRH
jgi:hypothetical protein